MPSEEQLGLASPPDSAKDRLSQSRGCSMPKVTILHFSDAHWHPSNAKNLSIVIKAMVSDMRYLIENKGVKFDLVF